MKKQTFLFFILGAALLQVTILNSFKILGIKPDLLLICACFAGIYFDLGWAYFCALLCGVFKDIFGVTSPGINTLLLPFLTFIVFKLARKISSDSNSTSLIFIFLVSSFNDFIFTGISFMFGNFIPGNIFLFRMFLAAIYNTVVAFWIFKFFAGIVKYLDRGNELETEPDFDFEPEFYNET